MPWPGRHLRHPHHLRPLRAPAPPRTPSPSLTHLSVSVMDASVLTFIGKKLIAANTCSLAHVILLIARIISLIPSH